jgi:hypothetical protein
MRFILKYLLFVFLITVFVFTLSANGSSNWGQRKKITFAELKKNFGQPDMIYAPFWFWFWDEPINDPNKAKAMAQAMIEQHTNPGYAHARISKSQIFPSEKSKTLPLPKEQWLSPIWFKSFDTVLKVAEDSNAYFGYCDEYMWPSLQAAGRVAAECPELEKATSLKWRTFDVKGGQNVQLPNSLFTVAAQLAVPPALSKKASIALTGDWIWYPDPSANAVCFRKVFSVDSIAEIEKAYLRITADDTYTAYINGSKIGSCENWQDVNTYDVSSFLKKGINVLAVECSNKGAAEGLTARCVVSFKSGKEVDFCSDKTWVSSAKKTDGWQNIEFDPSNWVNVSIVAKNGEAPWNICEDDPHTVATIKSESLKVIGSGEPFNWSVPKNGDWRIYSFSTYHHDCRPNVLDDRLGQAFIKIAHEPYEHYFGKRMGKALPGVFVDHEGDYGYKLAWSNCLQKRYQEKWKRDIRLWMPLMIDKDSEGKYAKARWEWFDTVSDIYTDNLGSVSRWLEQRNMYAISNLWEESLMWQVASLGDVFKTNRAYSMPGTDCLVMGALDPHDFKEVQSIAEFENRRMQSEIMGAGGWGCFTPVNMKKAVNAVVRSGVSHIVPHGVFMTRELEGNNWVPDWYDRNPMWSNMHIWADFVRRACYVNSHGYLAADVLLINPMDSVWAVVDANVFDPSKDVKGDITKVNQWFGGEITELNKVYADAIRELTKYRIEYLIADRYYVRQMKINGARFERGEQTFKTVVLPSLKVLPIDVAQKIVDFAKSGGNVYALGQLPAGSTNNGLNDLKMQSLMKELMSQPTFVKCQNGIVEELQRKPKGLCSQITFNSGEFEMMQTHRRIDGQDFFWLANNTGKTQECVLRIPEMKGQASIWNCETGNIEIVSSAFANSASQLSLKFGPYEGYWLVLDSEKEPKSANSGAQNENPVIIKELNDAWLVSIDPNVQPNLEFPVTVPANLVTPNGKMQNLGSWENVLPEKFSGMVDYDKTINLTNKEIEGNLLLDLGDVQHFAEVWINDKKVGTRLWPPFTFDITGMLNRGQNKIKIRIGNLINDNYGQKAGSGLFGPVVIKKFN